MTKGHPHVYRSRPVSSIIVSSIQCLPLITCVFFSQNRNGMTSGHTHMCLCLVLHIEENTNLITMSHTHTCMSCPSYREKQKCYDKETHTRADVSCICQVRQTKRQDETNTRAGVPLSYFCFLMPFQEIYKRPTYFSRLIKYVLYNYLVTDCILSLYLR